MLTTQATTTQETWNRSAREAGIEEIAAKVLARERLSCADGLRLYRADLHAVGMLANHVRERMHGDLAYFNVNQHVNYTNICIYSCKFCAFAAKEGEERGYLLGFEPGSRHVQVCRY